MSELREIALDELPAWSPWPARMLGLAPVRREARTPAKVMREYDEDKYGPLLAAIERDPSLSVDDVKRLELGDVDAPTAMSVGDRLYVAPLELAIRRTTDLLIERVGRYVDGAASITDLGCGYGHQLAKLADACPGMPLHGGEFAPRAVEVARRLGGDRFSVEAFDFASGRCGPLLRAPSPSLVVSSYAISQLPSAAIALDTLAAHRDRIARVVSWDVDRAVLGESLLGLMRRRYVDVNEYSGDMLDSLRARDDVVIEEIEPNVVGPNALLPATLVVWRFT